MRRQLRHFRHYLESGVTSQAILPPPHYVRTAHAFVSIARRVEYFVPSVSHRIVPAHAFAGCYTHVLLLVDIIHDVAVCCYIPGALMI